MSHIFPLWLLMLGRGILQPTWSIGKTTLWCSGGCMLYVYTLYHQSFPVRISSRSEAKYRLSMLISWLNRGTNTAMPRILTGMAT